MVAGRARPSKRPSTLPSACARTACRFPDPVPGPGGSAGGLHSRTIEVLDQRGIADRFLAEGQAMQVQSFAGIPLDISDPSTGWRMEGRYGSY